MRLFIAADLPGSTRESISDIQNELKKLNCDIKWVEEENLHLTLKFIGDIEESAAGEIKNCIAKALAGAKKIRVSFVSLGILPGGKRPRILFVELGEGAGFLKNTADSLDLALSDLNIEKEKRAFLAHLTIGRFRSARNVNILSEHLKKSDHVKVDEAQLSNISLIQSRLEPGGPVYNTLERYQLCG